GVGSILSGKLLCYNALTSQTTVLKINKTEAIINSDLKDKNIFSKKQLAFNREFASDEVSIKDVLSKENIQFIDVREVHERPKIDALEITSIPLSELENSIDKILTEKQKVIFCQSGMRSKK